MESIKLKKGEVHLMEDHLIIEGDGAIIRKNWNLAIGFDSYCDHTQFLLFERKLGATDIG